MNSLDDNQLLLYSKQILVNGFDVKGQQGLFEKKILIVGVGGLGCTNALYLSGSGVGEIHLLDYDNIELSNLPRQILFNMEDIGKSKSRIAKKRLQEQFKNIKITAINDSFSFEIAQGISPDLIVDCGDNIALTYQISEYAHDNKIPAVHASVSRTEGHLYSYIPGRNKPINEIFTQDENIETCSESGVMTPVVGLVASMQAWQVIRILSESTLGKVSSELLLFDGKSMRFIPVKM